MLAVIGHGEGFGEALGFVVATARANGIDVAPVGFDLRMNERVAIDLGSGGEEEFGGFVHGQSQCLVGSQ